MPQQFEVEFSKNSDYKSLATSKETSQEMLRNRKNRKKSKNVLTNCMMIARTQSKILHAFSQITCDEESFDSIYIYTAVVCVIVLNPDYPDIECTKKLLQHHFLKFKVFFFG